MRFNKQQLAFLLTAFDFSVLPVFSNILKDSFLHELADADEGELIKQVQASARPLTHDTAVL